jgi:hypothetical protein
MSKYKIKILKDETKLLNELSNYVISIGVVSKNTDRKIKVATIGLTNAELMFIHENGSPMRNIPSRPVLDMTIKWAMNEKFNDTIDTCINGILSGWSKKEVENELNKLCVRMEDYARHIIYDNDGRLIPNSPRVAKAKKGNHPLFDTGQLARSITCQLDKIIK